MRVPRRTNVERLIERQIQSWAAQRRAREQRGEPAPEPRAETLGPYIAVSREVGSGGTELAQLLGDRLGWTVYDREIVDAIAKRANVRTAVIRSLGETWFSAVHDWITGAIDVRAVTADHYVQHLVEVVVTIARAGPAVFLGRGVAFILPPERGLRVRVIAPIEKRIEAVMRESKMSEAEARRTIATADASRDSFIRAYFDAKCCDPLNHDVTINTELVGLEEAADACIRLLRARVPE